MNIYTLTLALLLLSSHVKAECPIAFIPDNLIESGCGCSYFDKNKKKYSPIYQSELRFKNASMYLNGNLVKPLPVKVEGIPYSAQLGQKFVQEYEYEGITIIFENTVTFVCPPGLLSNESCESTSFNTILQAGGECALSLNNIKGSCGC